MLKHFILKITREIKTAVLVIASILLFIWGYSFLKGSDLLTDYKTVYVKYANVEGLANSAPVTINGLTIGKVSSIKLLKDYTTVVELQIKNGFDFPKSSIAEIYSPGPLGGRQIGIVPGLNDNSVIANGDYLKSANKLGLTEALGDKLEPLQVKLDKVLVNADALLTNVNTVLDANTKNNLKNAIAELNKTLANFSKVSSNFDQILVENKTKLGSAVTNLDKTTQNFAKISDDLEKAQLGETVKSLDATLSNVNKMLADMQSGKGTMGKLMKDETMYNNLSKASKELELLLQDVRLHPTRYVNVSMFGKKEKPYVEPAPKN